jgi:hypothetical protein
VLSRWIHLAAPAAAAALPISDDAEESRPGGREGDDEESKRASDEVAYGAYGGAGRRDVTQYKAIQFFPQRVLIKSR